jgi:hypothetical protein
VLERNDGTKVTVGISALSSADQVYVQSLKRLVSHKFRRSCYAALRLRASGFIRDF